MQKRRNIRLLLILIVLIGATVLAYFVTRPEDRLDVKRELFSYADPSHVNKVEFVQNGKVNTLMFNDREWKINDKYEADQQRVSVLFAVLKQVRVRRRVSKHKIDSIESKMRVDGVEAKFYEGDNLIKDVVIWGDEDNHVTYMQKAGDSEPYIVEIPGYRSYLAGIYDLDENGWRNPLVFDVNWNNLERVKMDYALQSTENFTVEHSEGFYHIPQIEKTDSLKLTGFLDDVSLLYVNDYLNETEVAEHQQYMVDGPQAVITVEDIANKKYTLEVFKEIKNKKEILVRIDSSEMGVVDYYKIKRVLRPKDFFIEKKRSI